jgi:hypothetical protein
MRKIFLIVMILSFCVSAFAGSRIVSSFAVKTSSGLVKRGDWKIYRIDFIPTANNGSFAIYDALNSVTEGNIRTEGKSATSGNGISYDFANKPLEGSTGIYLVVDNASVVIRYE